MSTSSDSSSGRSQSRLAVDPPSDTHHSVDTVDTSLGSLSPAITDGRNNTTFDVCEESNIVDTAHSSGKVPDFPPEQAVGDGRDSPPFEDPSVSAEVPLLIELEVAHFHDIDGLEPPVVNVSPCVTLASRSTDGREDSESGSPDFMSEVSGAGSLDGSSLPAVAVSSTVGGHFG